MLNEKNTTYADVMYSNLSYNDILQLYRFNDPQRSCEKFVMMIVAYVTLLWIKISIVKHMIFFNNNNMP